MKLLINDWQTWVAYSSTYPVDSSVSIVTESPGVYEILKESYMVKDISDSATNAEANKMGEFIIQLSMKWQELIDEAYKSVVADVQIGRMLGRFLPQIMLSCCYSYTALRHLQEEEIKCILLPFLTEQPQNNLFSKSITQLTPLTCNYFALVAQGQNISRNIKLIPLPISGANRVEVLPSESSDQIPIKKRINSTVLRLTSTHNQILPLFILKYIYQNQHIRPYLQRLIKNDYHVFIYKRSNLILSSILPFFLKRIAVTRVNDPDGLGATQDRKDIPEISLMNVLSNTISDIDSSFHYLKQPLGVAAIRTEKYLNHYLIPYYKHLKNYLSKSFLLADRYKKNVLLSNCIAGPEENLLGDCFRKRGIPVINFEHGAIGLIKHYRTTQLFSDMTRTDGYVCFNEYERRFYRELT